MEQTQLFECPPIHAGRIYFGLSNGIVKIGFSTDPARRAKELGMKLLLTMPGSRDDERRLHRQFRQERLNGEWFLMSPRIMMFVEQMLAKHRSGAPYRAYVADFCVGGPV